MTEVNRKLLKPCMYHKTAHLEGEDYSLKHLKGFVDPKDYSKLYSEDYTLLDSGYRLDDDCRLQLDRETFNGHLKHIEELYKYIDENQGKKVLWEIKNVIEREVPDYRLVVKDDEELWKWIPALEAIIKILSSHIRC